MLIVDSRESYIPKVREEERQLAYELPFPLSYMSLG